MGNVAPGATMMHEDVWMLARDAAVKRHAASRINQILTGTWLSTADLSLPSIPLAVFAPQLRHRSIAMSYPGNLSFPTSHRAGGPG